MIDYSQKTEHDGAIDVLNVWQQAAMRLVQFSGKRVLDIGCGSGSFLYHIKSLARSVLGVDPNARNIDALVAHGIPGHVGYIEDYLAETREMYDIVTCFEVVEHLYEPWGVFQGAHNALELGGAFVVSTPNAFHLLRSYDFVLKQEHRDVLMDPTRSTAPEHMRLWSQSMLVRAFITSGFKEVQCCGVLKFKGRLIVLKNKYMVKLFAQNLICIGIK